MSDLPPSQLSPAIISPRQQGDIDENLSPPTLQPATLSPIKNNPALSPNSNAKGTFGISGLSGYRNVVSSGFQTIRPANPGIVAHPTGQVGTTQQMYFQQTPTGSVKYQQQPQKLQPAGVKQFQNISMATAQQISNPRFQINPVQMKNVVHGQNILQVPKQPLPAHISSSVSNAGIQGAILIPHQQFGSGTSSMLLSTTGQPMNVPPAHCKPNVTGISPTVTTKPFPAHQQPLPAHQKVQYITSANAANRVNLQQPILIPANQLSSSSVVQTQSGIAMAGNQMIGQPIVASTGPVYVAVPNTTVMTNISSIQTTGSNTTAVTSSGHQQRPLMIRAHLPTTQQVVRLTRAHSPAAAGVHSQQFTFIQRQPSPIPQQRLAQPGTMVRAQIIPSPQPPPAHSNNQQPLSAALHNVQGFTMIQVASSTNPNTTVPARFAVPLKIMPTTNVQQLGASNNNTPVHSKPLINITGQPFSSMTVGKASPSTSRPIDGSTLSDSYDLSIKNISSADPAQIPGAQNQQNIPETLQLQNVMSAQREKSHISGDATCGMKRDQRTEAIDKSCVASSVDSTISTGQSDFSASIKTEPLSATEQKDEGEPEEFVWDEYLEETGSIAAPPTSFKHVETSLKNGFVKGMKIEVPNKCVPDTYWIATIILSCGPLLRLRYDGYDDDSSKDFWCDTLTSDIHEIGWCGQNGKTLQPPDAIHSKQDSWHEFLIKTLEGAVTAPAYLLDKSTGIAPIDQIKAGMRVIVQHDLQPLSVWIAKIIQNVGGRLLLRWEGTELPAHDFWLFYLHYRVHPITWAAKDYGFVFRPPDEIKSEHANYSKWSEILLKAESDAESLPLVSEIFTDQPDIPEHTFEVGMKLEIIHPRSLTYLCPATVTDVLNKFFFLVRVDDLQPKDQRTPITVCRHAGCLDIFPVEWSLHYGVRLMPPKGWVGSSGADFSWESYLSETRADAAPETCFLEHSIEHEFKRGMKLEAMNPHHPEQICAATITKIVDRIMWVHLDSSPKLGASFMTDINSYSIFPVGWCESNGYHLKPPKQKFSKRVAIVRPEFHFGQAPPGLEGANTWCPKIYFNHRCFSGPFLSKGRIAELPKSVGPGPVNLVLKEVLSMLINVAYKSSRVLRELQLEGDPNNNMHQQCLKAKYKGKSYRATVEICRTTDQLEEFCRQTCIKLECCPYLVGPLFVNGSCPENCQQLTKTKYTHYYGKKKKKNKIGRPPGGHTNLEVRKQFPGRKKKRRHPHPSWLHGPKKIVNDTTDKQPNNEPVGDLIGDNTNSSQGSLEMTNEERMLERKKRKYIHHVPQPSDIRTRGAKLPRYSFERRTHKKVLIEHRGMVDARQKRMMRQQYWLAQSEDAKEEVEGSSSHDATPELVLDSNPLTWSVAKVVKFIKSTDCAQLARLFREQEIDGQAFLLLNLPSLQEHLELKLGPAIKLCHQIEKVKIAFYHQFA